MKFQLPASDYPLIRVLILSRDSLTHMDFSGEQPQEVDVDVPAGAKVGYVSVAASGQEVGDPVLLHVEPEPEPDATGKEILGKPVVIAPVPPVAEQPEQPAAKFEMEPSTVVEGIYLSTPKSAEERLNVTETLAAAEQPEQPEQPAAEAPPETIKVEEKVAVKTTRKGK